MGTATELPERPPAAGSRIRGDHLHQGTDQVLRLAHRARGHHLRHPQGQDQRHHGPVGHRQVGAPQEHHRPAAPRRGRDLGRRRGDRRDGRAGPLPGPPQVRRPLPGRRPVRLDEHVRQHRLPAPRAHQQDREGDPARSSSTKAEPGRPPRPHEEVPRRGVRRHEEAGRPGPGPGHGPRDRPLRRARLRPRPRPRVLPRRAGEEDPGGDRRHLLHHHPQHRRR